MVLKKTLCGLAVGLALFGSQQNLSYASEIEPMIPRAQERLTDVERRAQLKTDLYEIVKSELDGKKTEIEAILFSKDASGFVLGVSYKPEFFPKHFRATVNRFEKEDLNVAGIDWYGNFYTPFLPRSSFIQIGLGLSYFDRLPADLASNFNFHTVWKSGFISNDGTYIAIGLDHWSNAGLVPDTAEHKNNGKNAFGFTIGKIFSEK